MKYLLPVFCLFSSLSSYGAICGVENNRLAWTDDVIMSQFECQNETTTLCASHAILLGDGIQYFVLAGLQKVNTKQEEVKSFMLLPALSSEEFFEDNLSIRMKETFEDLFSRDAKRVKVTFTLDKVTGEALYLVESRKLFLASPWLTVSSEKLRCQSVGVQ